MRKKDTQDVISSMLAIVFDALAVYGGFMMATVVRFFSGLISVDKGVPVDLWYRYGWGAIFTGILFPFIFRALGLYVRPQTGSFTTKIPRIIKGVGIGILFTAAIGFAIKLEPPFSTMVVLISFGTILLCVLLERYLLFRFEWNWSRHSRSINNVLIIGTSSVACHVRRTVLKEPMLRSKVLGFVSIDASAPEPEIDVRDVMGDIGNLESLMERSRVDQVILTSSAISHARIVEIMLLCENHFAVFNMVPDLFGILTSSLDVQALDDIPLLGVSKWPLDYFWNRTKKRLEDVAGAASGLLVLSPFFLIVAVLVKLTSKGPVFFRQERCGENGESFHIYKFRTMRIDAEDKTGPVFASEDDPRTTSIGAFMRRQNLDELPQLWNVLLGDMSLVGPRPERPHFVDKFKDDISRYMSRHVSKPGMTGWAQVNGLRGNTSIEERIKYDLYYLEHWSLAFDFKIILKTFFARENAY